MEKAKMQPKGPVYSKKCNHVLVTLDAHVAACKYNPMLKWENYTSMSHLITTCGGCVAAHNNLHVEIPPQMHQWNLAFFNFNSTVGTQNPLKLACHGLVSGKELLSLTLEWFWML